MTKFFVVGDITVDQMYFVNKLPEKGGETNVVKAVLEPGGAAGTMATILAKLGNQVSLASSVGTGPFAKLALSEIIKAGVDISKLQYNEDKQTSTVSLLITPDGERTMISSAGASRQLDSQLLQEKHITDNDALVMSAYSFIGGKQREYSLLAFEIAKNNNIKTFIDMGSGAVNALEDNLIPLLKGVDYLLMNQHELFTITSQNSISDAVSNLSQHGIGNIIVKLGAMGSMVITSTDTELVEALELDNIVDTTGAGDNYTAAFAHSIMQGKSLLDSAYFGNVVGALSATIISAQKTDLSSENLNKYYQ